MNKTILKELSTLSDVGDNLFENIRLFTEAKLESMARLGISDADRKQGWVKMINEAIDLESFIQRQIDWWPQSAREYCGEGWVWRVSRDIATKEHLMVTKYFSELVK